jgi:hypothetical protein
VLVGKWVSAYDLPGTDDFTEDQMMPEHIDFNASVIYME